MSPVTTCVPFQVKPSPISILPWNVLSVNVALLPQSIYPAISCPLSLKLPITTITALDVSNVTALSVVFVISTSMNLELS